MRRPLTAVVLRPALATLALGSAGVLYGFPLYWLFVTSLKSKAELFATTVSRFEWRTSGQRIEPEPAGLRVEGDRLRLDR